MQFIPADFPHPYSDDVFLFDMYGAKQIAAGSQIDEIAFTIPGDKFSGYVTAIGISGFPATTPTTEFPLGFSWNISLRVNDSNVLNYYDQQCGIGRVWQPETIIPIIVKSKDKFSMWIVQDGLVAAANVIAMRVRGFLDKVE